MKNHLREKSLQYMFKALLIVLAFAVTGLTSCKNLSPSKAPEQEADASDLRVKDFISIDTAGKGNEIILAKMCTEHPNYKYMYQLRGGTWVASNEQWCVGNVIQLTASKND